MLAFVQMAISLLFLDAWWLLYPGVFCLGMGCKSIFIGMLTVSMGSVDPGMVGMISGVFFMLDAISGFLYKRLL